MASWINIFTPHFSLVHATPSDGGGFLCLQEGVECNYLFEMYPPFAGGHLSAALDHEISRYPVYPAAVRGCTKWLHPTLHHKHFPHPKRVIWMIAPFGQRIFPNSGSSSPSSDK